MTGIVITKLDTLAGFGPLQVCVAYERDGKRVDSTPADEEGWATLKPVYEALPGIPTTPAFMGANSDAALPREARDYVSFMEKRLGVQVSVVSTGPQREAMIRRGDVLGF